MLRAPTEDLEQFKECDFSFWAEGGKTHPKNTVLNFATISSKSHQIALKLACPEAVGT